jgi:hypothetical protein
MRMNFWLVANYNFNNTYPTFSLKHLQMQIIYVIKWYVRLWSCDT